MFMFDRFPEVDAMFDYAKLAKAKRESQMTQAGGISAIPAGVSNQAMIAMLERQQAQTAARPASGGTPLADAMKAKFERQFGLPMDDVRVHRNSDEPAKFDAGAYTYGTDIFIGPGQEDTLEHEMTHVAQQKLGQVRPTGMEHGMAVNRSPALEHSADMGTVPQMTGGATGPVVQCGDDDDDQSVLEPPAQKRRRTDSSTMKATQGKVTEAASAQPSYKDDIAQFAKWRSEMKKYVESLSRVLDATKPSSLADNGLNDELKKLPIPSDKKELVKKLFRAKRLFTAKNLKGASASGGKFGSIYFGGSYPKCWEKSSTKTCASGGRLRLLHKGGPQLRVYPHVKRRNVVDEVGKTYLSENMITYENESRNHKSRGRLESRSIDPGNLIDPIIEKLIYAVAYAETMAQEKQSTDTCTHANSFLDSFISSEIPGLHPQLNREGIELGYYGSASEQRRRS